MYLFFNYSFVTLDSQLQQTDWKRKWKYTCKVYMQAADQMHVGFEYQEDQVAIMGIYGN